MRKEIDFHNLSRHNGPLIRARYCDLFFCRLRGLMFQKRLAENEGLLLVQTRDSRLDSSVHMFFMRMDLAIVWIDTAMKVVDVQVARRWRPAYLPKSPARYVLEMPVSAEKYFSVGDLVRFEQRC